MQSLTIGVIMRGYNFIIIFSTLLTLAGCNYNISKQPAPSPAEQNKALPSTTTIDWNTIHTKVLNTCTKCHSGSKNPTLADYATTVQNFDKALNAVVLNSMPPVTKGYVSLSACQKSILAEWKKAQFPLTSTQTIAQLKDCTQPPDENIPLELLPPSYTTLVERIIGPRCVKCHNPDDPDPESSGILFVPYSEIIQKTKLITQPAKDSKLIKLLTVDDKDRMPPPEDKGGMLPASDVDYIIRWIDAGMPQ